jgi:enterobactin synthetase component D
MNGSLSKLLDDLRRRQELGVVILSIDDKMDYYPRPAELKGLSGSAVRKRQVEFASGRAAAQVALKNLGITNPPPIPRGLRGEPVWPEGIVGSITHSGGWAIVVVGRNSQILTIGIDLENLKSTNVDEITPVIATHTEQSWIQQSNDPKLAATMLFGSKEATFKALNPHCERFFDFADVELTWFPYRLAFRGSLLADLNSRYTRGYEFEVACRSHESWVFAYLIEYR